MGRRLNDPVFDEMKVIVLPRGGRVLITCKCWRLKPERRNRNGKVIGRKSGPGQQAVVSSLDAARDWARDHLNGPHHVTTPA